MTTAARARRGAIGVDVAAALSLVGRLTKYLSVAAAFPAAIALGYHEPVWPFIAAGAITAALGFGLEAVGNAERVGVREGFLAVSLVWLVAAGFGALPYVFAGEDQLSSPVDAYFESMSGFTTTGATVLTDIDGLSRSLAMWRQFTTWLGGSGFIVLALAVLPRLRVGGRQMFETEAPGPEVEDLTTTIRGAARRFIGLYIAITGAVFALLLSGLQEDLQTTVSWVDFVLHRLMPIVLVLDWLLDRPRHVLPWWTAAAWLAYPLAWLAYTLLRGAAVDWYPYPFVDVSRLGYDGVALRAVALGVGFGALAWAFLAVGNRRARA